MDILNHNELAMGGGGALAKIWFFYSLSPIDPLFSTHLHPMKPFCNNLTNNFNNLSPNNPHFWKHVTIFQFFSEILSKICPNLYFAPNLAKTCLILIVWPLFREKSLTERPLLLSYCPSTPSLPKSSASLALPYYTLRVLFVIHDVITK